MRENVLYSIICEDCKSKERSVEYWGETGRDCFSRGGEHVKGCREQNEDNPMWKHIVDSHESIGGEELFSMRMEAGFRKPLARQIREGVEIESCKGELMNSKSEWYNSKIPRIIIETGEKLTEDKESGLGNKSEKEKRMNKRERGNYHLQVRNPKRREVEEVIDEVSSKKQRVIREIEPKKRQTEASKNHQKAIRNEKRVRGMRKECEGGSRGVTPSYTPTYWKEAFKEMAEKQKKRTLENVKGAIEHIERIEKGRNAEKVTSKDTCINKEGSKSESGSSQNRYGDTVEKAIQSDTNNEYEVRSKIVNENDNVIREDTGGMEDSKTNEECNKHEKNPAKHDNNQHELGVTKERAAKLSEIFNDCENDVSSGMSKSSENDAMTDEDDIMLVHEMDKMLRLEKARLLCKDWAAKNKYKPVSTKRKAESENEVSENVEKGNKEKKIKEMDTEPILNPTETSSKIFKISTRLISPGILKIRERFENNEKGEPEVKVKSESKVKQICNSLENMMENRGARRKVYEVKKRRKKSAKEIDRNNPIVKEMEKWSRSGNRKVSKVEEMRNILESEKDSDYTKLGIPKLKTGKIQAIGISVEKLKKVDLKCHVSPKLKFPLGDRQTELRKTERKVENSESILVSKLISKSEARTCQSLNMKQVMDEKLKQRKVEAIIPLSRHDNVERKHNLESKNKNEEENTKLVQKEKQLVEKFKCWDQFFVKERAVVKKSAVKLRKIEADSGKIRKIEAVSKEKGGDRIKESEKIKAPRNSEKIEGSRSMQTKMGVEKHVFGLDSMSDKI